MANTIKIKNSGTASAAPSTLEHGELGLNYADGKLFYKNSSNTIVEFGSSGSLNLDGLTDVIAPTPSDGDILAYTGGEVNQWVSVSIAGPLSFASLDNIGDVLATYAASGEVLEYNGNSWVNKNTVRDNMIKFYMEVI